jgi:cysteine desulfurase
VAHGTSARDERAYWDAGSAAPLLPAAREALLAALDDGWADPRRLHSEGRHARALLDGAREAVAAALGARTEEVTFAPNHTAALHAAVLGTMRGRRRTGAGAVHSAVEHSGVLHAVAFATAGEGPSTSVPVDGAGRVDSEAFADAVHQPGVALAALQQANGEVGTTQPVEEAYAATRAAGVPLLVDAGAAVGHLPTPPLWDLLVASAHAWGGPPGVGVLAVRAGVRWSSPWPEDESELGRHPGEVAVPSVLAAAVSLQVAMADQKAEDARRRAVVDELRRRVAELVPDVEVVGDAVDRLPHVLTFSCLYADGEALVGELDRLGFAVGSGSACTSSTLEPSHVLAAMGVLTHGNVRVALPAGTAPGLLEQQAERFLSVLPGAVQRVRELLGTAEL